ncbi:hypothetical protein D3C75_958220 [compost metagenome]
MIAPPLSSDTVSDPFDKNVKDRLGFARANDTAGNRRYAAFLVRISVPKHQQFLLGAIWLNRIEQVMGSKVPEVNVMDEGSDRALSDSTPSSAHG